MARQEDVSVQYYEKTLVQNPKSLVFSRLADCYRKKGEIQQAIGVCMDGLKNHPTSVTGRVILGRCYLEQEKLKEAVSEFVQVVELDRRNQVALKMLADVYMRQGFKEKAGDLYACLLRMDPDNASLVKLSASNQSTGETNIQRILGIAAASPALKQSTVDAMPVQSDFIDDSDKTIQLNIGDSSADPFLQMPSESSDSVFATEQPAIQSSFDEQEPILKGADDVVETVSPVDAVVTGDDISSRMSDIFDSAESPESAVQDDVFLQNTISEPPPITQEDASMDIISKENFDTNVINIQENEEETALSGADVTSRMDQLFGDESLDTAAFDNVPLPELTDALPNDNMEIDNLVDNIISENAIETANTVAFNPNDLVTDDNTDLSGVDVTDRINEMFADSSSIETPLAEIGKMLDQQQALEAALESKKTPNLENPSDIALDSFTESIDSNSDMSLAIDTLETVDQESLDIISGDDVASRLNSIFDEDEKLDDALKSEMEPDDIDVLGSDVPVSQVQQNELTFDNPVEKINIATANELSEINSFDFENDATVNNIDALEKMLLSDDEPDSVSIKEEVVLPDIPEAVSGNAAPTMSGEDVVGRLDELFSDSLDNDGGLAVIPDEEKEEDAVGMGFYTMSGENAETSLAADSLLSELDSRENETAENELLDIAQDQIDQENFVEQPVQENVALKEETRAVEEMDEPSSSDEEMSIDIDTDVSTNSETEAEPKSRKAEYSIPDHVLTPTLADIYYQQGQPKVALEIYNRLLENDPNDERILSRIQEIEQTIAAQFTENMVSIKPVQPKSLLSKQVFPDADVFVDNKVEAKKTVKPKKEAAPKPLSGVRIKKKFKKGTNKKT